MLKNANNMNNQSITVLLFEDDSADASLVQNALAGSEESLFHVEWVTQLSDALERLSREIFEAVLLDLSLLDSQGIEALEQLSQAAPNALILVLSLARDEEIAREAVQRERGAYDYLIKEHIDAYWFQRALRYVIEHKAARKALRRSEVSFRAMSDASPLGLFVSDEAGHCVYTNEAYHKISGLTFYEALGTNWHHAIHPEDRQRVLAEWRNAVNDQKPFQTETRFLRKDNSIVWTRLNTAVMREGKRSHGYVQTIEDITDRKSAEFVLQTAEEELFEEKERAQVTLNSIGDAVLSTDLSGNVTYMNLVAEKMTGWSREDASGRPLSEVFNIIDGKTRQVAPSPSRRAIEKDGPVELAADCVLIRRDGFESSIEDSAAPIHNRDGQVTGAVIVFHDVSESRAMATKMAHLAQHDYLTGLPNRALLTERLSQAIGQADRHHKHVALLFLDLDFFKYINDSLGHSVGDQLLQSAAARLTTCVRATDTVCRQGGDEFVILLAETEQQQDAADIAEKLLSSFAAPHIIGVHELHLTLSIGISVYPNDGLNAEALIQNADTAMYHAKTSGRNNYKFFMAEMNERSVQRLFVENSLRRALKQDEFLLHYQPQIDITSGKVIGAEALIRWMDPELGLVYPERFVAIAEKSGLIVPIGQWVLREACKQIETWLISGLRAVPVAVNISAMEFRNTTFLDEVALVLKETGIAPHYLKLELTESILMHDVESSVSIFESLKTLGVKIAIDDFGTGYSSLSYLKRFPIGTLKIDQSFVNDITTDADDATIVSAVIGMGRNLNLRVIAEGVETTEQLEFLRVHLCDEGQGFLFSHPLPAEDFALMLNTENEEG